MAFYGTNPTGGYFKMTPRATVPTFPGTYGPGDKEGTFYFNDGSGTITAGLWVFQGTAFAAITKNTDATELITGQVAPDRGGVPIGTVIAFAGAVAEAPSGYLFCNGGSYSQSGAYSSLYTAIKGRFGNGTDSTGSTTFAVPDIQGRFLRGATNDSTRDPNTSTRTVITHGTTTYNTYDPGSLQEDAFQDHRHTQSLNGVQQSAGASCAPNWSNEPHTASCGQPQTNSDVDGGYTSSTVGSTARTSAETRPKNVYVNYYIKYIAT